MCSLFEDAQGLEGTVSAGLGGGEGSAIAEKKPRKRKRLKVVHPERCIGCLCCMFACSRINTGRVSLERSAIRIQTQGGIEGDFQVVVCHACKDPSCVRACPTGALSRKPDGKVVFDKSLCKGCGSCADACLVRAIHLSDGLAVKCKHCGACVAFCPHGVLELVEVELDAKPEVKSEAGGDPHA